MIRLALTVSGLNSTSLTYPETTGHINFQTDITSEIARNGLLGNLLEHWSGATGINYRSWAPDLDPSLFWLVFGFTEILNGKLRR